MSLSSRVIAAGKMASIGPAYASDWDVLFSPTGLLLMPKAIALSWEMSILSYWVSILDQHPTSRKNHEYLMAYCISGIRSGTRRCLRMPEEHASEEGEPSDLRRSRLHPFLQHRTKHWLTIFRPVRTTLLWRLKPLCSRASASPRAGGAGLSI